MAEKIENTEGEEALRPETIQANFSALLYVITEQEALIGNLLQTLMDSGMLSAVQLNKITDIRADHDQLSNTYSALYRRYATYYKTTFELLKQNPELHKENIQKWKDSMKRKGDDDDN